MITVEEVCMIITLLEKEKQRILTLIAYHSEDADVINRILQTNYKNKIKLIENLIAKLNQIKLEIEN